MHGTRIGKDPEEGDKLTFALYYVALAASLLLRISEPVAGERAIRPDPLVPRVRWRWQGTSAAARVGLVTCGAWCRAGAGPDNASQRSNGAAQKGCKLIENFVFLGGPVVGPKIRASFRTEEQQLKIG